MIYRCLAAAACIAVAAPAAFAQDCIPTKRPGTELTGLLTGTLAAGGARKDFTLTLDKPICVSGKAEDGADRKEPAITVISLSPATVGAREDLPGFNGRQMTVSGEFKFMYNTSPLFFSVTRARWPDKPQ